MAKPVISVAFHPKADIGQIAHYTKNLDLGEGNSARYLNCSDVSASSFGLLRLVPVPIDDTPVVAVYVPPQVVLWMLEAEKPAQMGFL